MYKQNKCKYKIYVQTKEMCNQINVQTEYMYHQNK